MFIAGLYWTKQKKVLYTKYLKILYFQIEFDWLFFINFFKW